MWLLVRSIGWFEAREEAELSALTVYSRNATKCEIVKTAAIILKEVTFF